MSKQLYLTRGVQQLCIAAKASTIEYINGQLGSCFLSYNGSTYDNASFTEALKIIDDCSLDNDHNKRSLHRLMHVQQ